jgi:hypothetical protein
MEPFNILDTLILELITLNWLLFWDVSVFRSYFPFENDNCYWTNRKKSIMNFGFWSWGSGNQPVSWTTFTRITIVYHLLPKFIDSDLFVVLQMGLKSHVDGWLNEVCVCTGINDPVQSPVHARQELHHWATQPCKRRSVFISVLFVSTSVVNESTLLGPGWSTGVICCLLTHLVLQGSCAFGWKYLYLLI